MCGMFLVTTSVSAAQLHLQLLTSEAVWRPADGSAPHTNKYSLSTSVNTVHGQSVLLQFIHHPPIYYIKEIYYILNISSNTMVSKFIRYLWYKFEIPQNSGTVYCISSSLQYFVFITYISSRVAPKQSRLALYNFISKLSSSYSTILHY